jgi:hypothetical protein
VNPDKKINISMLSSGFEKLAASPSNLTCDQPLAFPQITSGEKARKYASSIRLDGVNEHK